MAKHELHCCDYCGRDTVNKSRICKVCTGGNSHRDEPEETLGDFMEKEWRERSDDVDEEVSDAMKDCMS